jgi:hypothetical protein
LRKFFEDVKEKISIENLAVFIEALYNKTIEEIDLCSQDSVLLRENQTVQNLLNIFVDLTRDQRLFDNYSEVLDRILRDYCNKLQIASVRDPVFIDTMIGLLKGHFLHCKSNPKLPYKLAVTNCHTEFIAKVFIGEKNFTAPNLELDTQLLVLLNLYSCYGFAQLNANLRDEFVLKMKLIAIRTTKKGHAKDKKFEIAKGLTLLSNLAQNFNEFMIVSTWNEIISEAINAINISIEPDCCFQSGVILLLNCIIFNTRMTISRLIQHEQFTHIFKRIFKYIDTLRLYSYHRKVSKKFF